MTDEIIRADDPAFRPSVVGLVRPIAPADAIVQAMREYVEVKQAILVDSDIQKSKNGNYVKRSGWAKLAVAFGVSTEKREKIEIRDETGKLVRAEYTVRAVAPNGRYADGTGICAAAEARFQSPTGAGKIDHDIVATAETRARNRAYANLFGQGEVSAEERDAYDADDGAAGQPRQGQPDVYQRDRNRPAPSNNGAAGDASFSAILESKRDDLARLRGVSPEDQKKAAEMGAKVPVKAKWSQLNDANMRLLSKWLDDELEKEERKAAAVPAEDATPAPAPDDEAIDAEFTEAPESEEL